MFTKRNHLMVLVLLGFILGGCGLFESTEEEPTVEDPIEQIEEEPVETEEDVEAEEPAEETVNQDLEAWMPRVENASYTYAGEGNEYASYIQYPQFNQDNYYQVATSNPGTTVAEVFEYREDKVVRTFQMGEVYYRDNFTSIGTAGENPTEETVLKLPIEVGANWSGKESTYEITAVNYEVIVPAGTYDTIEVTNTFADSVTKRYYAEDIGLVLEITELADGEVSSKLETLDTDVAENIPFAVYVPDEQAMGMDTIEAELTLMTNDPARIAITELLSGEVENFENLNILPTGTQINYLFKNNSGIVEADVSSEFVENMNAGSTGELFFLFNLVNTLSDYYGSNEVLLTVDGNPYEGAHMALQEGEVLQFNQEMVN